MKVFPLKLIETYRKVFSQVSRVTCHCKEKHGPGCGCLHPEFIARTHTSFTSILMECQSSEEFDYQLSTNLGLLQANLTYMHKKLGTHYHWIPELYRRIKLPVFDGLYTRIPIIACCTYYGNAHALPRDTAQFSACSIFSPSALHPYSSAACVAVLQQEYT